MTVCTWNFQLVGVLVFSAAPFMAVKAIANSSVGVRLRMRMENRKMEEVSKGKEFKAAAAKAREER